MTYITVDVEMEEILNEATDEQINDQYVDRFGSPNKIWEDIRYCMQAGNEDAVLSIVKNELYERFGVIF